MKIEPKKSVSNSFADEEGEDICLILSLRFFPIGKNEGFFYEK